MSENRPPTEEEKEKLYGCAYCCAVGACPRCHGRSAIDALKAALEAAEREKEAWKRESALHEADWVAAEKTIKHIQEGHAKYDKGNQDYIVFLRSDLEQAEAKLAKSEEKLDCLKADNDELKDLWKDAKVALSEAKAEVLRLMDERDKPDTASTARASVVDSLKAQLAAKDAEIEKLKRGPEDEKVRGALADAIDGIRDFECCDSSSKFCGWKESVGEVVSAFDAPAAPGEAVKRKMLCSYGGAEQDSSPDAAFFESHAAGSDWAKRTCAVCRYAPKAHESKREHLAAICGHKFVEHPGEDADRYYCGCYGWD
jgi:hypothetical protein